MSHTPLARFRAWWAAPPVPLPPPARPARWQIAGWVMVLLACAFISLRDFNSFEVGAYLDDADYITLARSLTSASQFGLMNAPGAPASTRFPFGFPLALAPVMALFPNSYTALKGLSLAVTLLNASLLFWGWPWFSRGTSRTWGLAVTALYALSRLSLEQTRMVMSEPLFTTFCLLALLLAEQSVGRPRQSFARLAGFTLALAGVIFTRTVGFAMAAGLGLYLLYARRGAFVRELAVILPLGAVLTALVVGLTPVAPRDLLPREYIADNLALAAGGAAKRTLQQTPYVVHLGLEAARHVQDDLRQAVLSFGSGYQEADLARRLPLRAPLLMLGIGVPLLVLLGFGRWLYRDGLSGLLLCALAYGGLLLVVFWLDVRMLYPIQMQLHLAFLLGVESAALGLGRLLRRWAPPARLAGALVAVTAAGMLTISIYQGFHIDGSRAHKGDLRARTLWVAAHTPPQSVLLSRLPEVDYLYSGRSTVLYPRSWPEESAPLLDFIDRNRIDYILITPPNQIWRVTYVDRYDPEARSLLRLLAPLAAQGRVALVYISEKNMVEVYRVLR